MKFRWALTLSCNHTLLADDPVPIGAVEYCNGCGMSAAVVDCYIYHDGDV